MFSVNQAASLIGRQFDRLTVVAVGPVREYASGKRMSTCECKCSCGAICNKRSADLLLGKAKSCGCLRAETLLRGRSATIHGLEHTREYRSWSAARSRCFNSENSQFKNYGGRGITMCDEWRDDVRAFVEYMGLCPVNLTLERIDNDGHYEPGNCKWANRTEQLRNRRISVLMTHNGLTLTASEWAKLRGIDRHAVARRIQRGITGEAALQPRFRKEEI